MKLSTLLTAFSFLFIQLTVTAQTTTAVDKSRVQEYFQEQQYDEAIQYLQPIVTADSANQAALRSLGYAYYMNENVRDAKTCYHKMFSNDSLNITANHYLATIYYNRDPDEAMGYFARLIQLQPKVANYYRGLGELYSRKKEKDTALTFLHTAYSLAPGDFRNLIALAEVLIDVKDYVQADSLLAVGLGRDSLNMGVLRSCVRSAYENKNFAGVTKPGETLMLLSEFNLSTMNKVILAYYGLQQYDNAVRVCEYLMRAGLEVESVYYYAAKSYGKLKQYDRSNELLDACLQKAISKTGEMYLFAYGENYEATKQYKKAVAAYDTAYYLYKSPLALYNCGRIYEVELKNEVLARKYYSQYLLTARPVDADERKAYAYVKERWGKKNSAKN